MNKIITFLCIVFYTACSGTHHTSYTVIPDDRAKVLKGIINRSILESDTSFKWFKENMKWGQADTSALAAFRQHAHDFTMVVFGGTWCEDTQNLWPVFFRLVDHSNYPEKNITLIAVDRKKQTIRNLSQQFKITNVPTFIVLQNGKEIGRVTEYGKINAIDKELGEIVNTIH